MLTPQIISLIAQLAVILGKDVVPAILRACHPHASEPEYADYHKQIDSLINK